MRKVILDSLKKYKLSFLIHFIFIGLNIYILTIPAKIIGDIVDMLYDIETNKQYIINNIYFLLGICVVLICVRMVWKYTETVISRGLEKDIKLKLFKRFLKLKLKDIQNIKNGEIMSYFVKDTNEIRGATYRIISHGARIFYTFIIAIYQMASGVNIYLTIATIIPIIIACFMMVKIKNQVEKSFVKAQKQFTELSEYVQESTDSIQTTKAYVCEKKQLEDFIKKNRKVKQSNNTVDIYSNLLTTTVNICFGLCYSIALLYGGKLVVDGQITVGELITFNGYIGLFVGPVKWIPTVITRVKRAQISYKRLNKVFELDTEKINVKEKEIENVLEGNIVIKDLTFHYPKIMENALENINIKIKKGETLGIIGTIGSGKTTLMNLLTRLYSVPRGKIEIDGKDINDIPIEVLRENICYITQDNFLFSSTLKDNISLFKEEYRIDEIKDSTKKAVIYDEISKMPKGIETKIQERGVDLSGGQKQRVAISRAFLKNSHILIFDDTFSALDNRTSQSLLKNIKEFSGEKTCIIISNKVSDIKDSNEIIVLKDGEIIERGNHEQLIKQHGLYNEFYEQQFTKTEEGMLV